MLFKGNSSKLELLIEKIQANKETFPDTLESEPSLSWNSETGEEDEDLSPSSCATPTSIATTGDGTEVDLSFTIGPTESTPYACQFCDKAFPRLSYLKKHEQSHSDQMPFKCDFCQRLFKHKRSRDRHVKLHTGDKKYRCLHCESAFSRSDHLKIHMKTHDHQKPYQCVICNRGYNTAAALTSHMQNHKKESLQSTPSPGPFRCLQCTGTFMTGEDLQSHVVQQHRTEASWSEDGKKYENTNGSTSVKSEQFSPKTPISSPSSSRKSSDLTATSNLHSGRSDHFNSLPSPSRLMLPFGFPKLACMYCANDTFTSMEALQLHVQALHGPLLNGNGHQLSPTGVEGGLGLLPCAFCTMKFPTIALLHEHAVGVHSLSSFIQAKAKENVFCAQCALAFPNSIAYAEHFLLFHANERKTYNVISPEPPQVKPTDLSKKKRSSASISPGSSTSGVNSSSPESISSNGGASKKSRKEMNNHHSTPKTSAATTSHTTLQQPSLLCNQCSAGFSDFESFRTHLKTHLEGTAQKFVCEECDNEFCTEEQLEAHSLVHYLSTSTEYGCQSCLKLFNKPDELQKHLMDIHAHHLYRCALCKDMFDSKVSIQVHFAVKHSNECKLFRCTSCSNVFRTEIEFQMHVKLAHLRKLSPYRCLLCPSSFASELDLQFHLSTHQKQFTCHLCDEAFHVEFLLDKHMQTHHLVNNGSNKASSSNTTNEVSPPAVNGTKSHKKSGSKATTTFKCDICDKQLANDGELAEHRKQTHNINGDITSRNSNNASSSKAHANHNSKSTNGNPPGTHAHSNTSTLLSLHCAYCNENCKSRTELETHMKTHMVSSSGKHKCNICDEVCPTATLLAEHKLTHCKVISGSMCTTCRVNVTSEEEFCIHMKQHGSSTTGSSGGGSLIFPVGCIVCRQTLMSEIEVQMHARFHTRNYRSSASGDDEGSPIQLCCCLCLRPKSSTSVNNNNGVVVKGPFICDECCTTGSQKNTNSDPDKSYQCIKCQKSFSSEEQVQSHVASHLQNEGSNHECHLCSNGRVTFDTPLRLQAHLIEHTFEGCSSFNCYMCSTVFTAATGLQQHMVMDHGLHSRPYDCSYCHLKFFFRAELDNHMVIHEQMTRASIVETSTVKVEEKGHGQPKSGKKKTKKKFFYRSDDSDEEDEEEADNLLNMVKTEMRLDPSDDSRNNNDEEMNSVAQEC